MLKAWTRSASVVVFALSAQSTRHQREGGDRIFSYANPDGQEEEKKEHK